MTFFPPVFSSFFGILNKVLGKLSEEKLDRNLIGQRAEYKKTQFRKRLFIRKQGRLANVYLSEQGFFNGYTFCITKLETSENPLLKPVFRSLLFD